MKLFGCLNYSEELNYKAFQHKVCALPKNSSVEVLNLEGLRTQLFWKIKVSKDMTMLNI